MNKPETGQCSYCGYVLINYRGDQCPKCGYEELWFRVGKVHYLKTWPQFFELSWNGCKPFEHRDNDRGFKPGDTLVLMEYDPETNVYSGREVEGTIMSLVTKAPGLTAGYCVAGLTNMIRRRNSTVEWEPVKYEMDPEKWDELRV